MNEKLIFYGREYSLEEFGFKLLKEILELDITYQREFFSLWEENSRLKKYKNEIIETTRICPTILDLLNIEIPKYMTKPL